MPFIELHPPMLTGQLGASFEVCDLPPAPFQITLKGVVEHTQSERHEAFSVFFLGPLERFIPQGIHTLRHAELGELEIFLVPVAQHADAFEYEAVFNYIR